MTSPTALRAPRYGSLTPLRLRGRAGGVDRLLIAAAALCLAGALSVYAATRNGLRAQGRNPAGYLVRDLVNIAVGAALAFPVSIGDYRRLRAVAPLLYAAVCAALLVVLSPAGTVVNGARAWFALGPVQLEPSAFAKLAVVVMMAAVLASGSRHDPGPTTRDIALALVLAGVPMLLILAEPALGIALVVAVLALTTVAVAGAPGRWVVGLLAAVAVGAVLLAQLHLVGLEQVQRFTAFTDLLAGGRVVSIGRQHVPGRAAIGG